MTENLDWAWINNQEYQKRKQEKLLQISITRWKACLGCGTSLNMKVPICPLCEREQEDMK